MSILSRTEEVVDAIALDINRLRYRLNMLEGNNVDIDTPQIKIITHTDITDSILKDTRVDNIVVSTINDKTESINIIRDFDGNITTIDISII